ncbi:MAG: cytidine deaminase [Burkholderiales bacterium]|nr:cytidine deaminase [Burkholderiales bacterium]
MLDSDLKGKLLSEARKAREQAYAPYSGNFKVGAAVLTENGEIFSGCNVENASFGATICAERVAVFKAVAAGYRRIRAVAVIAETPEPVPPCGMCRQVIAEFGGDADVLMANTAGNFRISNMRELLPGVFEFRRQNQ